MRHSLYKYFTQLDHAKQLLQGKVLCRTAAYFRDYEDAKAQQIIGDEYEGTRLFRPATGLDISIMPHGKQQNLQMGFESQTKAHEIYVYCLSLSYNDVLKNEFNALACVEICKPREFMQRWTKALPDIAKNKSRNIAKKVSYYDPTGIIGNVWACPELITTSKIKKFKYQDEYRLAFTTTDAFDFQNCKYELVDRKARPLPKPEEHYIHILELGGLDDICKLHAF